VRQHRIYTGSPDDVEGIDLSKARFGADKRSATKRKDDHRGMDDRNEEALW